MHDYVPFVDCDNYGAHYTAVRCTWHVWYQTPHCVTCGAPMDSDQHTEASRRL